MVLDWERDRRGEDFEFSINGIKRGTLKLLVLPSKIPKYYVYHFVIYKSILSILFELEIVWISYTKIF